MNVGEVWRLQLGRFPEMLVCPPHTENWNIISKELTERRLQSGEIKDFILKRMGAPYNQPSTIFDGHVELNENGKGYIDASESLPPFSIGFWRFHNPLYLDYDNNENEDGNYYRSEKNNMIWTCR